MIILNTLNLNKFNSYTYGHKAKNNTLSKLLNLKQIIIRSYPGLSNLLLLPKNSKRIFNLLNKNHFIIKNYTPESFYKITNKLYQITGNRQSFFKTIRNIVNHNEIFSKDSVLFHNITDDHLLENSLKNLITDFVSTDSKNNFNYPVNAKPAISRYNPATIQDHLKNNFQLQKYLPIYEEHHIHIPYIIETHPTRGITGSYTLP